MGEGDEGRGEGLRRSWNTRASPPALLAVPTLSNAHNDHRSLPLAPPSELVLPEAADPESPVAEKSGESIAPIGVEPIRNGFPASSARRHELITRRSAGISGISGGPRTGTGPLAQPRHRLSIRTRV